MAGLRWDLIPLDDAVAWERAIAGVPHAVAHRVGFRRALTTPGADPIWLFRVEDPAGTFVCPIAERTFAGEPDGYTPWGFAGVVGSGAIEVFQAAWRDLAASRRWVASYIALHPLLAPPALVADRSCVAHGDLFAIDLAVGPEALLRDMSAGTRRALRVPGVADIAVDTPDGQALIVRRHPALMRARGAEPSVDAVALERLVGLPESTVLAWPAEAPACAAMFGVSPWCAAYLFAAEEDGGRGGMAPVMWAAMQRFAAAGVRWLDLGGEVPGQPGVAEFKRRLGAARWPIRSLQAIHRPEVYARLTELAGPDRRPGWFPAYSAPSASLNPSSRPASIR